MVNKNEEQITMRDLSSEKTKDPSHLKILKVFTILNNSHGQEVVVNQDDLAEILQAQRHELGALDEKGLISLYGLLKLVDDPTQVDGYSDMKTHIVAKAEQYQIVKELLDRVDTINGEVTSFMSGSHLPCYDVSPSFVDDPLANAILRRHVQTLPERVLSNVEPDSTFTIEAHDHNGWSFLFLGYTDMPDYDSLRPHILESGKTIIDERNESLKAA